MDVFPFTCATDSNSREDSCVSWLTNYCKNSVSGYMQFLYRLTNVKIKSGTGAEDNPFILENKS